ncbi:hypothetical protein I6F35_35565 [Bradyrhizobium sp. BRP22]|nr:hypothetical protein [Bradyrhizobium sp. BRP22]
MTLRPKKLARCAAAHEAVEIRRHAASVIITEELRLYGAAGAKMGFDVEHHQHKLPTTRARKLGSLMRSPRIAGITAKTTPTTLRD